MINRGRLYRQSIAVEKVLETVEAKLLLITVMWSWYKNNVLIYNTGIVKNAAETLRKICEFLEITCTEQYLQDCAATVDPVPSITRDFITWTAEQKTRVYEEMKKYSFFTGYSYEQ